MSETQVEQRLKEYLPQDGAPMAARDLINRLQNTDHVSAVAAKMALLRLANRSEVRVTPDLGVRLAGHAER